MTQTTDKILFEALDQLTKSQGKSHEKFNAVSDNRVLH